MTGESTTAIREALASAEFEKAQRLWGEYAGALQQAILRGTASKSMLGEAGELVQWARQTVRAWQAHAQDSLNRARVAQIYTRRAETPASSVRTSL